MLRKTFVALALILCGTAPSVEAAQPCQPCYNQWILVENPTFMRYNSDCPISWRKGPIQFETINGLCVLRRMANGTLCIVNQGVADLTYTIKQTPQFVHGVLCPCPNCRSPYRNYSIFRVHRHIISR